MECWGRAGQDEAGQGRVGQRWATAAWCSLPTLSTVRTTCSHGQLCVCVCRPGLSLPACLGLHLQLSAVRRGNIPLAMADHLLVLNWNRQAPLLLRQLATNGHGDSKSLGR